MAEQNPGGGGRGNDGAMAAQNPGGGGRGNDVAMAAQNPGGGGRGNDVAMAEQNPGGGGRGNDGAMAEQNPGGGGRGNDGAMAEQNPGGGGRGNDGAMAEQNPGGGGRGNDGAMAAQNPGGGGRGNDGAVAAQNPGGGGRGNDGAVAAQNGGGGRGTNGAVNPGGAIRLGVSNGGGGTVQYGPVAQYMGRGGGDVFVEGEDEIPEFLPPDEALGGYIFMCDERTLPRITELMMFGYPIIFRNRVQAITTGLPLFLYNISTKRLHGVYEAAGNGGYNIEPSFFPCFHDLRRSSFPAQVRVRWRTEYQPLTVLISRLIMVNLRIPGNKFYQYRVELSDPEAACIINAFAQHGVAPE